MTRAVEREAAHRRDFEGWDAFGGWHIWISSSPADCAYVVEKMAARDRQWLERAEFDASLREAVARV